jgi:hypothetical protein
MIARPVALACYGLSMTAFDDVIAELHAFARANPDAWARDAHALIGAALGERTDAFLAWARAHRRWSHNLAEAAADVCAKPRELAAQTLWAIVEELLDEDRE